MSKRRIFLTDEHKTSRFTSILRDEAGVFVPAADLTTLTLTLYQKSDRTTIINSRDAQSVLNVNNVTIDTLGNLVWLMQPADNVVSDQTIDKESHIALFQYSWNAGAKKASHEVEIVARRVIQISAL